MNQIKYELVLSYGTQFQEKFNDYMTKIYKNDYTPIKIQGRKGDRKVDGLLNDERIYFQVYAPETLSIRKINNKIDEDFKGFMKHVNNGCWKYPRGWVFVLNDKSKGIYPDVQQKIDELRSKYPNIKIEIWGINIILEKINNSFDKINNYSTQDKNLFITILEKIKPRWVEYFFCEYNDRTVEKRGVQPIYNFLDFVKLPHTNFESSDLEYLKNELIDSIEILTNFFTSGGLKYYFIEENTNDYFLDARKIYWKFVEIGQEIFNINVNTINKFEYIPDF